MTDTNRIEKKVTLHAPIARVWQAVSDSTEFGSWFGVAVDGPFVAGKTTTGKIVPTKADPEVAKMQEPHQGKPCWFMVERVEPQRVLAFRWHPGEVEQDADVSKEPTTLVTFELEEVPEGTRLTITETGFEAIPLERRARAFASNDEGWTHQARLIARHLANAS